MRHNFCYCLKNYRAHFKDIVPNTFCILVASDFEVEQHKAEEKKYKKLKSDGLVKRDTAKRLLNEQGLIAKMLHIKKEEMEVKMSIEIEIEK